MTLRPRHALPALAFFALVGGCVSVRPVEIASIAERPQMLVGETIRYVDSSGIWQEALVEEVDYPLLRCRVRYDYDPQRPAEIVVDVRQLRELEVVDTRSRDKVGHGIGQGILRVFFALLVAGFALLGAAL